jgi:hypothetical protein
MTVEPNAENRADCLCPHCPTYDECMTVEEELLYCGSSVTMCENTERQGCVCGRCTVHGKYDLFGVYYCIEGPAS